jgi:hypothetical protein
MPYEDAVAAVEANGPHFAGVGFCFTADDDIVGIDLDDCLPIQADAREILERFQTYAEVSPSGKGIKLFGRATKAPGSRNRTSDVAGFKQIEVYDADRFFTVTGDQFGFSTEVADVQEGMDWLCDKFLAPASPGQGSAPAPVQGSSLMERAAGFEGTDNELIEYLISDDGYSLLWNGDTTLYDNDASRADLALLEKIAWLVGPVPERIERIFSRSELGKRDKWLEREDYRTRSIEMVLGDKTSFYSGGSGSKPEADTRPQATRAKLISLRDVKPTIVTWHLEDYVPKGMTMMLASPGGVAKGLYTLHIAANYIKGPVIYCGAEDNLAMIIKPRAIAAGIDEDAFFPLREVETDSGVDVPIRFPTHAPILAETIESIGAQLVVIDAGPEHMEADLKANSVEDVRQFMSPLNKIAEDLNITIMLILHTNKTHAATGTDRVSGNRAWVDAQRHVLLAAIDDEDEDVRHFQVKKTNIAKQGIARQFRIKTKTVEGWNRDTKLWEEKEQPYLFDLGESDKDVDSLLSAQEKGKDASSLDDAILRRLSGGQRHDVKDFEEYMSQAESVSTRTVANHLGKLKRRGFVDKTSVSRGDGTIGKWVVWIEPKGQAHLDGLGPPGVNWREQIDWTT